MKIVVRGTNWIGDAVMTIPALRELRRIFPESEIFLHTRSWAKGIFQDADFINEILGFEKSSSKFKTVIAQAKNLKLQKFDLAVLFTNSFESALTAKLARIPRRFGYGKEGRSFLLTNNVETPVWKNEKHEVFYYLNLIAEIEKAYFGTETVLHTKPKVDLKVSEERKLTARKILKESGVDLSKKIIALGVGSTNSRAKRWQTKSYAELNDKLQSDLHANVILVGGQDELNISHKVFEESKFKPIILTGKTSLPEDEIIEVAPVIVMSEEDRKLLDKTLLHDYIFEWGETKRQACLALGYISLYNHSYSANCEYEMEYDKQIMTIRAVRSIKKGEELFINYNGVWDNTTELWFEVRDKE